MPRNQELSNLLRFKWHRPFCSPPPPHIGISCGLFSVLKAASCGHVCGRRLVLRNGGAGHLGAVVLRLKNTFRALIARLLGLLNPDMANRNPKILKPRFIGCRAYKARH